MVDRGNEQLSSKLHSARKRACIYGLLCPFCVPNTVCFKSFGSNRVGLGKGISQLSEVRSRMKSECLLFVAVRVR